MSTITAMITLTPEALWSLIEESEHIGTSAWKWGTRETYVCEREGKHFKFTVEIHSQDGLQNYGTVKLTEVRPVEKTIKVWEEV